MLPADSASGPVRRTRRPGAAFAVWLVLCSANASGFSAAGFFPGISFSSLFSLMHRALLCFTPELRGALFLHLELSLHHLRQCVRRSEGHTPHSRSRRRESVLLRAQHHHRGVRQSRACIQHAGPHLLACVRPKHHQRFRRFSAAEQAVRQKVRQIIRALRSAFHAPPFSLTLLPAYEKQGRTVRRGRFIHRALPAAPKIHAAHRAPPGSACPRSCRHNSGAYPPA